MLGYAKEYPFKGSYLYQEKNIRPKEGYVQLNFPINPRLSASRRIRRASLRLTGSAVRARGEVIRQLAVYNG